MSDVTRVVVAPRPLFILRSSLLDPVSYFTPWLFICAYFSLLWADNVVDTHSPFLCVWDCIRAMIYYCFDMFLFPIIGRSTLQHQGVGTFVFASVS